MDSKTQLVISYDLQKKFLLQVANNKQATQYLFEILYEVWDLEERGFDSDFINEIFESWVTNTRADLNTKRHNIRNLVNHIAYVLRLQEIFVCFNNSSDYVELLDSIAKEVLND